MSEKRIGKGAKVEVDHDGNLTYTKIGLMKDITPPGRSRAGADDTELDADLMTEFPGIEEVSEFTFTQFWHAGDSNHEMIDDLFDEGEDGIVSWRITYPYSTPVTDTFSGWVKNITPAQIVKEDIMSRQVTVSRTSAITRS
ncbi:phage tail tube protein [Bremerella cremea]|uniref:phage tail tube protein n=1 Tax=Bremerella cremea TaxID=1031537 RepID=UPI0031E874B6